MKVCNALCRDDTVHGTYYYLASEADLIIERLTAENQHKDDTILKMVQDYANLTTERDALAKDAARYRFIFAESERVDPVCALVWKKGEVRNSSEWVNSTGSVWMSKELDEAIAKESKT